MADLHFKSAKQLAGLVRRGDIGARELLEYFLARVDLHNPTINAVIQQVRVGARTRADAADAARKRGDELGPLHGVPMTIKESYNFRGLPTTWGVPELAGAVADSNAVAVERLAAAGANVFGKTNVPINLGDFQSYNAIYGVTNNPWRPGPYAGRIFRGIGRRPGRRTHRPGDRQRHWRLDPQSSALLRRIRPQTHLESAAATRAHAQRRSDASGHIGDRAAGPFGRRSRTGPQFDDGAR